MTGQLELFAALPAQGGAKLGANSAPARPLRAVPLPRYVPGDRRVPARLDPYGDRGLENGDAEVVMSGWGRQVSDVPLALAGAL